MANNLDLILRFLIDQQSVQAAESGTGGLTSDLERVDKLAKDVNKSFDQLDDQIKKASSPQEFEQLEQQLKDVESQVNDTTKAYRLQARVLRAEAAAISDGFAKARNDQLKSISEQIGGASRFALGAGVGLVGGIFAGAAKYVADAKEATAVTRAWRAEQEKLGRSGERFGAVMAEQALPLLRKAAELADKAADFVEANPGVIRAALNTGVALATLGAVGIAVSKGIKFYADIQAIALGAQQLAAAKLQDVAANKQLAAATLQAKAGGVSLPKITGAAAGAAGGIGGTIAAAATSPAGIGASVLGSVAAVTSLSAVLDKLRQRLDEGIPGLGGAARSIAAGSLTAIPGVGPLLMVVDSLKKLFPSLQELSDTRLGGLIDKITGLGNAAEKSADQLSGASLSVANSENRDQLIKAYDDYKREDLELVRQHYLERQGIIQGALNAEKEADEQYAKSLAKINANTSNALADAAADLANANAKAEQQYQQQRAQVIRDGNEEIEQIEQDSKERLAKLTQDHEDRVADLIGKRDALGLARENRDFGQAVREEKRQAQQEIKERREAIAQRLADLQASYEQERAQRLADYQARVAEIQANAAEQRRELAIQHAEEIKKIHEQRAARLKELDAQFADERKRRYTYLVQQLKDLDAGLFAINQHEKAYMEARVAQIQAIIDRANAVAAASTTTNISGRASGGYADYGLYRLGDTPGGGRGGAEFVMANRTVKAAENIIGGRLTQEGILSALTGGNMGAAYVTVQGSRYSGEYTGAMRRAVNNDIQTAVHQAIRSLIK